MPSTILSMLGERVVFGRVLWVADRISSGQKPTVKQLAEDYETTTRTIKRDIAYLRDMLGAPIEYDPASHGYYLSEPTWSISSIRLSESELFSLTIAADVLEAYRNSPLYDHLHHVFSKITSHLPDSVSLSPASVSEHFSVFHQPTSEIPMQTWEAVMSGLRLRRRLRFQYTAAGYSTSVSKVCEPYHCIGYKGEWYLIGHDVEKADLRMFALSRMAGVVVSDGSFEVPEAFRVEDYVDPAFGVHLNTDRYQVEVRFAPHLATYIRERVWHASQTIDEHADGSLTLTFETNQLNAVRFWLQSWGPGSEVLSPPELREQIIADLRNGLGYYGEER